MKALFAVSLLAVALVGCGGSSSSNNSGAEDGGDQSSEGGLTTDNMQDVLDQANTARDELDALLEAPQKVPFLARLNIGEEQTLVTQGVLSAKATCIDISSGQDGSEAEVEVSYISTAEGTLNSEEYGYMEQNEDYPFASSTDISNIDIDEGSVVAPTGDHISINGETMMLSANAQGTDCMVAGMAFVMKGVEAGEFSITELAGSDDER
jgi:hypothetical protein